MLGAQVCRPSRNVWSFLYPVCFNEQDICPVQRCQMCLGSHNYKIQPVPTPERMLACKQRSLVVVFGEDS